jgi:hypothetical protein
MMQVCEECHEADKEVIECCIKSVKDHNGAHEGVCDICGKLREVAYCYRYGHYIMTKAV